jgi:hypothetical protein
MAACAEPEPVLVAGSIPFYEEELLGLSDARRWALGGLASFGQAVAEENLDGLLEPYRASEVRKIQVERLSQEVTLMEAGVGEEELERRYRLNPSYELTVRHLIFLAERWQTEAARAAARARAEAALARAQAGEDFPALCAELSEEPGAAERQGLLQPGRQGAWVPEFWGAAAVLRVGELSGVVESQYGFHVLRLEGRQTVPFGEARHRVVDQVARNLGIGEAWGARVDETRLEVDVSADLVEMWTLRSADRPEIVASWGSGDMTAEEFQEDLAASGEPLNSPVWSDATAAAEAAMDLAVARALAEQAEAAGTQPTLEEITTVGQGLRTAMDGWARTLGFSPGMGPEQVKAAALQALGATGQNVNLARQELARWVPLFLLAEYPVTLDGYPAI